MNTSGILLSIDFEKAFDSLNWNYLMKTLLKVNFGNRFFSYIKTMYNNTQSAVINNSHISEFFPLERGVRQGCPLLAYLFILALEMLANKIRADKNVKGIIINNIEMKISLLSDDATCILEDTNSLKNLLNILNIFHLCSSLKINIV